MFFQTKCAFQLPLITSCGEQQRLRQDLANSVESKNGDLYDKFSKPAYHSSTAYEISKAAETVKSQTGNQIATVKKMIKGDGGPAPKRARIESATTTVAAGATGSATTTTPRPRKQPAWTKFANDGKLKWCGSFDEETKKRCGWNITHWFGPDCPVVKKDSNYLPRHWVPFGVEPLWTQDQAKGVGVKQKELYELYTRDVQRFQTKTGRR